jgi:hypothetical protein
MDQQVLNLIREAIAGSQTEEQCKAASQFLESDFLTEEDRENILSVNV